MLYYKSGKLIKLNSNLIKQPKKKEQNRDIAFFTKKIKKQENWKKIKTKMVPFSKKKEKIEVKSNCRKKQQFTVVKNLKKKNNAIIALER